MGLLDQTVKSISNYVVNAGSKTVEGLSSAGVQKAGDIIGMTDEQLKGISLTAGISFLKLQDIRDQINRLNDQPFITINEIWSHEVVGEIEGIGKKYGTVLYTCGITTLADLRSSFPLDYIPFIHSPYVNISDMWAWKDAAWFQIHPGINRQFAEALTKVGIRDFTTLLMQDPQELLERIVSYNLNIKRITPRLPTLSEVESWFVLTPEQAKQFLFGGFLSVQTAVQNGWLKAEEAWESFIKGLEEAVSEAEERLRPAVNEFKRAADEAATLIQNGLEEAAREMIEEALRYIFKNILEATSIIGDFAWQHLSPFLGRMEQAIRENQPLEPLLLELKDDILGPIEPQLEPLLNVFETVGQELERIGQIIEDLNQMILDMMEDVLKDLLKGFLRTSAIGSIFSVLSVFLGNADSDDAAEIVGDAIRNFWSAIIPPDGNPSDEVWARGLDFSVWVIVFLLTKLPEQLKERPIILAIVSIGTALATGLIVWAIAGNITVWDVGKCEILCISYAWSCWKKWSWDKEYSLYFAGNFAFAGAIFIPLIWGIQQEGG